MDTTTSFIIDELVTEDNFCNFRTEIATIDQGVSRGQRLALYAPRNYGKTSLVKNVITRHFRHKHKKCFVFFADLLELKNLETLDQRLSRYFESSFVESFPVKSLVENIKLFLTSLKPEMQFDPLTGQPTIQLGLRPSKQARSTQAIFKTVRAIAAKIPTLVILDEFQDIALVKGAQAEFRAAFQELTNVPIIVLGSKRHLLSQILANESAPLAFWGQDIELKPIAYETYHAYILERFRAHRIKLGLDSSRYLQDLVLRIPESINALCLQLIDQYSGKTVTETEINLAFKQLLENKASRYSSYCGQFSVIEEKILVAIAKASYVNKPQSKEFYPLVASTPRTSGQVFKRLHDKGVIEKDPQGYRISDPLFAYFLREYR